MWKLLYLDVRPLGLQALHVGQNLLLVAGQSHTHLSQFTARENRKKCRQMYNLLWHFSKKKSTFSFKCQAAAEVSCPRYLCKSPPVISNNTQVECKTSFTDNIDLLSVSFNWDESPAVCTWHWCRGLSPSWHIQHWKSSPYTGPSWWPPTTHPLCSHWTLGWTGPPCWDTKHTHNSMKCCPVEWLNNSFWLVLKTIICPCNSY